MESFVHQLVPITLFLCVTLTAVLGFYFAHRTRASQQETLRQAIQNGQPLDAQIIATMGRQPASPEADLRSGVINVCLGLGIAAAGVLAQGMEEDLARIFGFVAIIILAIGVGELVSWRLRRKAAADEAKA